MDQITDSSITDQDLIYVLILDSKWTASAKFLHVENVKHAQVDGLKASILGAFGSLN